jgi:hypothetical protein
MPKDETFYIFQINDGHNRKKNKKKVKKRGTMR